MFGGGVGFESCEIGRLMNISNMFPRMEERKLAPSSRVLLWQKQEGRRMAESSVLLFYDHRGLETVVLGFSSGWNWVCGIFFCIAFQRVTKIGFLQTIDRSG